MTIIFSHWNQRIQRKHLGKTQLFNFQYVTYHQGAKMDFSMFSYLNIFDCLDRDKINYKILHYLKFGVFTMYKMGNIGILLTMHSHEFYLLYMMLVNVKLYINNNKRITFHKYANPEVAWLKNDEDLNHIPQIADSLPRRKSQLVNWLSVGLKEKVSARTEKQLFDLSRKK